MNDKRARAVDETVRLGDGNKPLEGESRTWQWDETSPRGCSGRKPSRACETPRTDRRARVGPRSQVDRCSSGRDGERNLKGGARRIRAWGRLETVRTLKGRQRSREDEPDLARERGTTRKVVPVGHAGNRDAEPAAGNPMGLQGLRSQHSEELSTSREATSIR
jgi:hypothetical protein